jgi:hypothetical protein
MSGAAGRGAVLRDGRLAVSVAQLPVTYALHLTEADDVQAAIDAMLAAAACELPLLVVLGRHGPLLLPVPRSIRAGRSWPAHTCRTGTRPAWSISERRTPTACSRRMRASLRLSTHSRRAARMSTRRAGGVHALGAGGRAPCPCSRRARRGRSGMAMLQR